MRTPIRNIELAKRMFGSRGGQARKKVSELLDLGMMNLWLAAFDKYGEKYATYMLWKLIVLDPEQPVVPDWLLPLLQKHREYLEDGPDDEELCTVGSGTHA